MVQVSKAMLVFMIVEYLLHLAGLCQFEKWGRLNINESVFNCTGEGVANPLDSALQHTKAVFRFLKGLCFEVLLLLQSYEWLAMNYIISSQKNRDVNEIMFDHNHENMQNRICWFSHEENCYRRKEIYLKWFIWIDFILFTTSFISLYLIRIFLSNMIIDYFLLYLWGWCIALVMVLGLTLCC